MFLRNCIVCGGGRRQHATSSTFVLPVVVRVTLFIADITLRWTLRGGFAKLAIWVCGNTMYYISIFSNDLGSLNLNIYLYRCEKISQTLDFVNHSRIVTVNVRIWGSYNQNKTFKLRNSSIHRPRISIDVSHCIWRPSVKRGHSSIYIYGLYIN